MSNETLPAAVGARIEPVIRVPDPERAAFEAWWCKAYHPATLLPMEAGCYLNLSAGMAWDAWVAARPRHHEVGRLVNLADKCLHPDMMRALWRLEEESGRTLGRRALSSALESSAENLRLMAIELRRVADAL